MLAYFVDCRCNYIDKMKVLSKFILVKIILLYEWYKIDLRELL